MVVVFAIALWLLAGVVLVEHLAAGSTFGFDFDAYWMAAHRVAEGSTPYDPRTLAGPFVPVEHGFYLYPPVLAAVLAPLVSVPVEAASYVWALLHLGMLGAACVLMPVSARHRALTFGLVALSRPFLTDLSLGNVSSFVLVMAAATWRAWPRPVAGLPLAILIVTRITAATLLIPSLVGRRFRMLEYALATTAALVALSLPFVGTSGWTDYLLLMRNLDVSLGVPASSDLATALHHLGMAAPLATSIHAGLTIAVVIAVTAMSRSRDGQLGVVAAITAVAIASPLAWSHYLVVLAAPVAYLASRGRWWAYGLILAAWAPDPVLPFLPIVVFAMLVVLAPRECWSVGRTSRAPVHGPGRGPA